MSGTVSDAPTLPEALPAKFRSPLKNFRTLMHTGAPPIIFRSGKSTFRTILCSPAHSRSLISNRAF